MLYNSVNTFLLCTSYSHNKASKLIVKVLEEIYFEKSNILDIRKKLT